MLYPTVVYPAFLFIAVLAYWFLPAAARRYWLTLASFVLLSYLSWRGTLALLVLALFVFHAGQRIRAAGPGAVRTRWMTAAIVVPLAYLCTFKYLPSYSPPIRMLLEQMSTTGLLIPLGISYFTFKFVHYVIECRRNTLPAHDVWDFLCYSSLFSIFSAGPIERFGNLQPQLASSRFDAASISYGLQRILFGMLKKVLVVDFLLVEALDRISVEASAPQGHAWYALFAFLWCRFLFGYLDFSAYSDLAIGTSRLFGLRVIENFDWPVLRRNLSEFWRSWHMSLSSWCRDYVYFPVFGATRNPKIAVYASMIVLGYWHGPDLGWILWGAWHATGLAVWQNWQTFKRRHHSVFGTGRGNLLTDAAGTLLTINYVVIGGVWIAADNVVDAARFLYYIVVP